MVMCAHHFCAHVRVDLTAALKRGGLTYGVMFAEQNVTVRQSVCEVSKARYEAFCSIGTLSAVVADLT